MSQMWCFSGIFLPRSWPERVKSAVLHVISLAHCGMVYARGWAANSLNARAHLAAENERLGQDISFGPSSSFRTSRLGP